MPLHDRPGREESRCLLAGRVRVMTEVGDRPLAVGEAGPGNCWRQPPGRAQHIEAVEESDLIEVAAVPVMVPGALATRDGEPPRLLDREQVAGMLGVHRREVGDLIRRAGFPAPAGYFRGRMLWDAAKVAECVARSGRGVSAERSAAGR